MRKDIEFAVVQDVTIAVVRTDDTAFWEVFLINRSSETLRNVLVASKGYGIVKGEMRSTSTLRHSIPTVEANAFAFIEPISMDVFYLTNEYWLSYYIGDTLFDKKFIFVPESINEKYITFIPELMSQGVLYD